MDRVFWGSSHLYSGPVWSHLKACTLSSPSFGLLREDAPSWCRAPFEPEGLSSTILAILCGTISIHYGHVLIHFKGRAERLKQWVSMGIGLLILEIILHFTDASEALLIYEIIDSGQTTSSLSASAILEVALRVKKAKVEGYIEASNIMHEETSDVDYISDLYDSMMKDTYEEPEDSTCFGTPLKQNDAFEHLEDSTCFGSPLKGNDAFEPFDNVKQKNFSKDLSPGPETSDIAFDMNVLETPKIISTTKNLLILRI